MANRFKLDEVKIRAFLRDPAGEVGKMMERLADKVFSVAHSTVAVRTGETRHSIDKDVYPGPDNKRVQIAEVSASYAVFFLEKGTKRHFIFRHAWLEGIDNSSLRSDALDFFGPVVDHPGITPRPFLTTGLWSLNETDI